MRRRSTTRPATSLQLDAKKSLPGYENSETVETLDRLVPFDSLRQHDLVSRGRSAEKNAASYKQRPVAPARLAATERPGRGAVEAAEKGPFGPALDATRPEWIEGRRAARNRPRKLFRGSVGSRCAMARRCMVTGKGVQVGHNVSHANNKTKRRYLPNLQRTRLSSRTCSGRSECALLPRRSVQSSIKAALTRFCATRRTASCRPRSVV